MDPNIWGPPLWDMLFTFCFKCPPESVSKLQLLFSLLEITLPCSNCRRSYATYRKQLAPITSIADGGPLASAIWLWTIHDMVNQKIGKICITFDKLEKRYTAFDFLTSDFSVIDVLCLLMYGAKLKRRHLDFVRCVSELLHECSLVFRLPDVLNRHLGNIDNDPSQLVNMLFMCKNELFVAYGLNTIEYSEFDRRYRACIEK